MKSKLNGPDGLEAWCVALSACFINFVMAGLGRMSGVLYVAIIEIFEVNRLQASIPFSARSLARNLFGPVVGILGQKYGVRTTTLIGGIIGTLSSIFCYYAESIVWLTVLWGAMNGAGAALCMTLPQVVLGQHFKKYRTTASGIAFSGGCVASFLFPVLLEYLLKTYGIQGSFLILSGLIMNVIPAAMILRKPSWLKKKPQRNIEVYEKCGEINKCKNIVNISCWKHIDTNLLRQNNHLIIKLIQNSSYWTENDDDNIIRALPEGLLQKYLEDLYALIDSILQENCSPTEADVRKSSKLPNTKPIFIQKDNDHEKNEIILSAASLKSFTNTELYNLLSLQLKNFLAKNINDIQFLFPLEEEHVKLFMLIEQLKHIFSAIDVHEINSLTTKQNCNKTADEKSSDKHPNTFAAHIKTAFILLKNPVFLLISFSRSVHFLTFVPAMTILVDFSMDKGLLEEDGKYVIAAVSFGDLVGRLCFGWVTDKEYISLPRYMLLIMVVQGACTAGLAFMFSKPAILAAIAVFGLLQGSLFVRHPVLVSKYLASHEQSVAMGCFNFFSGLLGFALPNYIGYFRDTVGSYDCMFYINGAIGTSVGSLWAFEPYFVKWISLSKVSTQDPL